MKFDKDLLEWFWYYVNERHAIYLRRERGYEFPWTEDEILQTYKFCNVFRELDVGTIWLRKEIREPYAHHKELFFNIAMYRLYNYVGTAEEIIRNVGFIAKREQLRDVVSLVTKRKERGDRVFTGAHMITGTLGGSKIHQVFEVCLDALWNNSNWLQPHPDDNLQKAFNRLNGNNPGYGPFISYEVMTDLRHTRYLEKADDIYIWANAGPGAKRGVCRLLGLQVNTREGGKASRDVHALYPTPEGYIAHMRSIVAMQDSYREKFVPRMEARDVEHSLCEWDKYERTRNDEGRPRSKYIPPHLRQV